MTFQIDGMKECIDTIKTLEKLPQKCVNTAARKGILVAKPTAKNGGWVDQSGSLRKAIKQKAERTKVKAKKVYDLMPGSEWNDVFVKNTKSGKRYYYPASVEYGFRTKNGGYSPGFHYLEKSLVENANKIQKTIVDGLTQEIDKLK